MPESRGRDVSLGNIFRALLRLRKALLDDERRSYERVHGCIPSNGAFLQLVLNNPWFAWLRLLSQLIARLDKLSGNKKVSASAETPAVIESVRTLLMPTEEGEGFGRQCHDALQGSPDVVLEHAAVRALQKQSIPSPT